MNFIFTLKIEHNNNSNNKEQFESSNSNSKKEPGGGIWMHCIIFIDELINSWHDFDIKLFHL